MVAPTLEGRLLCCSRVADWIPLVPEPVYLAGAGFLDVPSTTLAGPDEIDAALVGRIPDGLVVAFRGTETTPNIPTLLDWVQDFEAIPVMAEGFPGTVHPGFAAAYACLKPWIVAELLRRQTGGLPVLVTGHSKGASIAMLAAWDLRSTGIPVRAVTFAGAKVGDTVFASAFAGAGISLSRFEYANDPVPSLPPSYDGLIPVLDALPHAEEWLERFPRFDYEHVGRLAYFDRDGKRFDDSPQLRGYRTLALALAAVQFRWGEMAQDHAIACGSGYQKAAAPTGLCS